MRRKTKIISRVSAVSLALIIALSCMIPALAATGTGGHRYSQYWGIKWKQEYTYSYTDAQGNSASGRMGASPGRFNVHYIAQNGQSADKFKYAQRGFCIEPEKWVEGPDDYGTSRNYQYTGNGTATYPTSDTLSYLSKTGIDAYDKRLTAEKKKLVTYILANGYGNYVPADANHVAYWYATQLLIYETVIGWRNSDFNAPSRSFEPNSCLTVESHSDVPTANHSPETSVAAIQQAYLNIVGWVKLTLKNPDGTSTSSSNCPTYTMNYSTSLGKYYYDYSFNDIIRQDLNNTSNYAVKLSALNIKNSDIIIYDNNSSVKVSFTIDKANKRIRFTTDRPLSGSIAIAFHNPRIRGINTSLLTNDLTRNAGLMIMAIPGTNNQAFARGAAPLIDRPVYFKLTTASTMKLTMVKKSANPDLTDGNSCYSLAGAVYGIYSDANCEHLTGQMITDEHGNASWNNGGTLPYYAAWAKEISPSPGYTLDTNIYQFQYIGKENGVSVYLFTSNEVPDNDPITVFLQKKNAITGQSGADLSGAVFKVCFYDGEYSDAADVQDLTALRTWYFVTDNDGKVRYDTEHLSTDTVTYPSDALYIFDGEPVLPNGSLSIQEVKAPTNYKVNPDIFVDTVENLSQKGVDQEPINPFVVNEVPVGGLTIQKTSSDNIVKDVWFRVQGDTGYQGGYNKVFKTNEDGFIAIKDDPDMYVTDGNGNLVQYTVTELGFANGDGTYTIPARYTPDHITQTTTIEGDGGVTVKFNNQMPTGMIGIRKTSEDGVISNIYFRVTGTNGYNQTFATRDLDGTGREGVVYVRNLPVFDENDNYVTYTVSEIGVKIGSQYRIPERYYTPSSRTVTFTNATVGSDNLIPLSFQNNLKLGDLKINKSSDDGDIDDIYFRVRSSSANPNFSVNEVIKVTRGVAELTDIPVYDENDQKMVYTITELGKKVGNNQYEIPGYYFTPDSQTVTIDADTSKQVSFHNYFKSFDLLVTKFATDNKIANVWFKLESSDGSPDDYFCTNSDGEYIAQDLPCVDVNGNSITYTITELGERVGNQYVFPSKYKTVEPQSIEGINYIPSTPGGEVDLAEVNFENTEIFANIRIHKTSEDGVVGDIWFSVTASDGTVIPNDKTNSSGYLEYSNLKVYDDNNQKITYTITELGERQSDGTYKIPYRYNAVPTQTITLECDETSIITNDVNFENTLKKGSVTINKKDNNGSPLAGVIYELHKSDGTLVGTKTTTSSGVASFTNLDQGNYYIVETKTVAGFNLLKDKIDVTVSGDSSETLNVIVNVKETLNFNLPVTGENGIMSLCIGGGIILLAGIGILIFIKIKKKK